MATRVPAHPIARSTIGSSVLGARPHPSRWFAFGDLAASILVGTCTASLVQVFIGPSWDMALAMVAGMAIGTGVHLVAWLLLMPALGAIEAGTAPGLAGMYGGMYFAMRESMDNVPMGSGHTRALLVGAVFGILSWIAVAVLNRLYRGPVFDRKKRS